MPSRSDVGAAWHRGAVEHGAMVWRSTYALSAGAEDGDVIELAYPLPDGTTVYVASNVAPVTRDGHVVGLRITRDITPGAQLVVAAREAAPVNVGPADLHPPLASGNAVQIVEVRGEGELRFEPDPRTGLARHVGFFAPAAQSGAARSAGEALIGYPGRGPVDQPIYVEVAPLVAEHGGISGAFSTAESRSHAGALGAAVVFVGIVLALVLGYRALARAAKVEQAERTLDEEFARLDVDERA